ITCPMKMRRTMISMRLGRTTTGRRSAPVSHNPTNTPTSSVVTSAMTTTTPGGAAAQRRLLLLGRKGSGWRWRGESDEHLDGGGRAQLLHMLIDRGGAR